MHWKVVKMCQKHLYLLSFLHTNSSKVRRWQSLTLIYISLSLRSYLWFYLTFPYASVASNCHSIMKIGRFNGIIICHIFYLSISVFKQSSCQWHVGMSRTSWGLLYMYLTNLTLCLNLVLYTKSKPTASFIFILLPIPPKSLISEYPLRLAVGFIYLVYMPN